MKRKAIVYKTITGGWCWSHQCSSVPYVWTNSRLFTQHKHAFIAAWWHVKACRGKRQYPESKERT